ncbi:hypothetical protein P280DRAFT_547265 [Massarina eburnea CBS 473.64]|uniref:Uncharacterized protein n=1 Tax=Massarina eburnea CBS 473.64 TaxID=1395130 RepID=A0A6A6S609_9PLEO|nr:hypothetical protein P280DRAFT_547265 [Massarina eburnea CBS 473.64]
MPKGKPKARFSDLYSDEDSSEAEQRRMAPKSVPHARGGIWEVKDQHKTGTHWDNMHHVDLRRAAEDAGLYKKDMSKVEMIHVLADKDRAEEIERRAIEAEERRRRRQAEARERKKQREMLRKKKDRRERREANEDYVSDTTEDDPDGFNVQSDGDSLSTTTPTTTTRSIGPIYPAQRLRIYEWPHVGMPPLNPSRSSISPISPTGRFRPEVKPELLPMKLPYAVMKLVTTHTKEKLELPGRQYSEEVGPDFVLSLTEHTKDCARNGVMYGQLERAVVESGAKWAERTHIQWWNGRMYFNLPPRGASKKNLADVYAKWKKKKEVNRFVTKKGRGINKVDPKRNAAQRLKDQRQKMLDVWAVSEHRPPICYMPSYLDYPLLDDDDEVEKSVENLFYIRFLDMELPHYYFWTVPGEWEDPTVPNPEWLETEVVEAHDRHHAHVLAERYGQPSTGKRNTQASNGFPQRPKKMLVKRTPVPRKFRPSVTPPKTSKYKAALWAFEKDLYHKGWATVLKESRERWIHDGKNNEWMRLIKNLPMLHPAGNLPIAPPINAPRGISSLAEKFAAIEVPSDQRFIQAIVGDEPWTRDDDAYWTVVDIPDVMEIDDQDSLHRAMDDTHIPSALERRTSEVSDWISGIPTSPHSPSRPPFRRPSTPNVNSANRREIERLVWEDRFLHSIDSDVAMYSTIERMPVTELKEYIHNMIQSRQHSQRRQSSLRNCAICLQSDGTLDVREQREHLSTHYEDAGHSCPFCGIPWQTWSSELIATHIFWHDGRRNSEVVLPGQRRSTAESLGLDALYAVPKTKRRSSSRIRDREAELRGNQVFTPTAKRKMSKVSFSPVTVERRVAYNDYGDETAEDADVSSMNTTPMSPRRSSLRSADTSSKARQPKSVLKVDTGLRPLRKSQSSGSTLRLDEDKRVSDGSFHSPSTPSAHITSPELHSTRIRRRPSGTDPHAVWKPRQHSTSGSDHVPSPPLHLVQRYPDGHPNAAWNPRKASKSSFESLEFYTGKKVPTKGKGKGKWAVAEIQDDEAAISLERKSSNSTTSKTRSAGGNGKRKAAALDDDGVVYEAVPESASSYEYVTFQVPKKRSNAADPTSRNRPSPLSPSTTKERPVKKRKTAAKGKAKAAGKTPRIEIGETPQVMQQLAPTSTEDSHFASTMSNASSGSDMRRSSDLSTEGWAVIATQPLKKRPRGVLQRRSSSATGLRGSNDGNNYEGDGYIPFDNDPISEDNDTDVLTGNPFAPPPKKGKAKATSKRKKAPKKTAKSKPKSTKEIALDLRKATEASDLALRHSARDKKTILGRPHIAPLIIAPAIRWTRSAKKSKGEQTEADEAPSTASSSGGLIDILEPPTPSPQQAPPKSRKRANNKKSNVNEASLETAGEDDHETPHNYARGRRSSAPTPSPSLVSHRDSTTTSSPTSQRNSNNNNNKATAKSTPKPGLDIEATKKRHSYDVPFSDPRALVPPNTPADGLLRRQRRNSQAMVEVEVPLDVGQLRHKIGNVKTTRGGLVRDIPATAGRAKGKPRGISVRKSREVERRVEVEREVARVAAVERERVKSAAEVGDVRGGKRKRDDVVEMSRDLDAPVVKRVREDGESALKDVKNPAMSVAAAAAAPITPKKSTPARRTSTRLAVAAGKMDVENGVADPNPLLKTPTKASAKVAAARRASGRVIKPAAQKVGKSASAAKKGRSRNK